MYIIVFRSLVKSSTDVSSFYILTNYSSKYTGRIKSWDPQNNFEKLDSTRSINYILALLALKLYKETLN